MSHFWVTWLHSGVGPWESLLSHFWVTLFLSRLLHKARDKKHHFPKASQFHNPEITCHFVPCVPAAGAGPLRALGHRQKRCRTESPRFFFFRPELCSENVPKNIPIFRGLLVLCFLGNGDHRTKIPAPFGNAKSPGKFKKNMFTKVF